MYTCIILKVDCILMEIYWSKLLEKLFEFWHVRRPQTGSEAIEVTATQLINHGQRPLTNRTWTFRWSFLHSKS